jgi:hypothetical protein
VPSQGGHGELDIAIETFSDCDRGQLSDEKNDDDLGLRDILDTRLQDKEFNRLTAYQLWALMSAHFLRSFFGDWYLQRFLSVVSV